MTEVKWDSGAPKISAGSPKNPTFQLDKAPKDWKFTQKAKRGKKHFKSKENRSNEKNQQRKNVESLKKLA